MAMSEYKFYDGDEAHPFEEIEFLLSYIWEADKPGSRQVVAYLEGFEEHFQIAVKYIVEKQPATITSDIALDRMALRCIVKYLAWTACRAEYMLEELGGLVSGYDLTEEAIAPVLEPDSVAILRESQKRWAQVQEREKRTDEVVRARIAATRAAEAHKTTKARKRPITKAGRK